MKMRRNQLMSSSRPAANPQPDSFSRVIANVAALPIICALVSCNSVLGFQEGKPYPSKADATADVTDATSETNPVPMDGSNQNAEVGADRDDSAGGTGGADGGAASTDGAPEANS